jgi:autotransporter-associated beta strand protein
LTATGQIILVNPAGIYFGPGSYVNVGGLIASTANIADQDFLNDYYHFANAPGYHGAVINQGTIIAADNGLVALIGGAVSNDGMIQANLGHIVLGSGDAFTLTFSGNDLIGFAVDGGVTSQAVDKDGNVLRDGVKNSGTLITDGGHIIISAKDASKVLDQAINMDGVAQTRSVYQVNGSIYLSADPDSGNIALNGKLDGTGYESGAQGGNVIITGHNIVLGSNAEINVSGDAGAGNVFIGGGLQGTGSLAHSNAVVMQSGARILADAFTNGNGGNVVLWSDYYTSASGQITARGGSESGDGGQVETSSKGVLNVASLSVDTTSKNGKTGNWLLDPYNVTISTAATSGGAFNGGSPTNIFTPSATSNVNNTDINTNLASTNVTITTTGAGADAGNITVSDPITWVSTNTLSLIADNNIIINAGISGVNGSLILSAVNASQSITTSASGKIDVNNFTLSQGQWYQVASSLPVFTVGNDFQLSGQFIRATSGDGTSGTPYVITDVYGLQGIGSSSTTLANYFNLGGDIDASGTSTWNSGAGFLPNGDAVTSYSGSFDGQNYTISNLTINRAGTSYVGLFGETTSTSDIGNLVFSNPSITGGNYTAVLAGYNEATVHDITVNSGTVTATGYSDAGGILGDHYDQNLTNLTVNNMTILGDSYIGGVAGYVQSANVDTLINNGSVVQGASYAMGGVIGEISGGTLTNLSNTGNVGDFVNYGSSVGGVVGDMYSATLSNASNTGDVMTGGGDFVGGVLGYFSGSTLTNAYNTGNVYGYIDIGGVSGAIDSGNLSNAFNTGNVLVSSGEAGGVTGKVFNTTINKVYNTGSVTNDGTVSTTNDIGGVVGFTQNNVTLTNAYNFGYVDATVGGASGDEVGGIAGRIADVGNTVGFLYNAGYVAGTTGTGAIFGVLRNGTAPTYSGNSYWNTETSSVSVGISNSSPTEVAGKTTAEMKQQATYSGWDFAGTWSIIANTSYPYMDVFYSSAPRIISGTTSLAGGSTVQLAAAGGINTTATIGDDGSFYFLTGNNLLGLDTSITDSTGMLIYFDNAASTGNFVTLAGSAGASATGISITNGQLTIGTSASQTIANSDLASAIGSLSDSNILYTASGNNITVNSNLDFAPTATTTYNIDGNLTMQGTGVLTLSGPVTLGIANPTLTITSASTISGIMGDGGSGFGFTKAGSGTLTLTGANTYSGTTTISAGILQIGSGSTIGTLGSGAVTNNATLVFNRSDAITVANAISGTGALTQSGGGTTIFTGSNSYSGTTTISAGTLQIGNGGTSGSLGTGSVVNNSALSFDRSDTITVGNTISGTGTLDQDGAGTLIITGSNTYNGLTSINAGTLQIGNGGTSGTIGTGGVNANSTLAFNRSDSVTFSDNILGTGGLSQIGSGTLILTGSNSYSGTTTISSGTLQIGSGSTTGTLGTSGVTNNAALVFNRSNSYSVSNVISGTGSVTQSGSGTLTLSGTNLYSGATDVNSGTISITSEANLGTWGGGVNVASGGTLNFNAATIAGAGTLTLNGGTLSGTGTAGMSSGSIILGASSAIDNGAGTFTLAGSINGANALTLQGAGSFNLTGLIGNITPLASLTANSNISGEGTINTSGNQTYNNPVTLTNDATFALSGAGTSSLSFNGSLGGGFNLALSGTGTGTYQFALNGITANNVTVSAAGGSSNNRLSVNSGATLQSYNITSADNGTVSGISTVSGSFTFGNIQNLVGGSNNDSFTLNGGTLTGAINGGGGTNTLTADNVTNTWNITANNGGTVTGVGSGFSNIQNLVGGTGLDTFNFTQGYNVSGSVNGGDLVNNNKIDFSTFTSNVTLTLNAAVSNIFSTGTVADSIGATIASFSNILQANGNGTSRLVLPTDPNIHVTYYDSSGLNGEISDPFIYYGFTLENLPGSTTNSASTNTYNSYIASIVNQPQTNSQNNDNYGAMQNATGIGTGSVLTTGILNTTLITPLSNNTSVQTGAACFRSN